MALRRSPEEKAARQAEKEQRRLDRQAEQVLREQRLRRERFFETPAGRARLAYDEGDHIFQCQFDVMDQQAVIVSMIGSTNTKKTSDPTDILNSICREGWELVTGSFVFVEKGSQTRDKLLSSGQNVSVRGTTIGYYLFRRCEANCGPRVNPWEQED